MSNFYWNNLDGALFCSQIRACYDEVAHWKRNLFQIPFGKAGKALENGASKTIPGVWRLL